MRLIIKRVLLCILMGLFSVGPAFAANGAKLTMEQRLQRIERILQNQSLADLVLQVQQLRQEVRQLRGDLEEQKYNMDGMSRRQRDLYVDIDQRLSRIQSGGAMSPTPQPVTTPVTPPPASGAVGQTTAVSPEPPPEAPANTAIGSVTPPDPKKESEAYQAAFNLLKQGRYGESITAFSSFLRDYPGGEYEDNAQYWLAEASYVNRDFDTALGEFTKIMENYPDSPKVPGAMLKIGYIQYEKKNWTGTRNILKQLMDNFPATTESRLAQKRLQRLTKEGH
ncbi:MAG: tol-pal system protein YbgF [Candidatus Thiodiazotropha sp. (ex Lucina pensylvanica)]|nr:tol-pal system protein YbgF [Candidatus Thiodiazotropha sp. (ex Lucina pensylvanica)]MBT3031624.1 tol-pal system protein YbgF [Candidatus Thiodiazotropha sp. (ex Lucina pensylvanica)]MBT3039951.1 tol-pal system protein YbgF [Candidatus Thiodiazotropha sp. (ex Codakia orbicularis)]MBT3050652.1 tol-pal system protein YbgF [Candidatus Thiodiazotropha sp. (ex Codakia orbicularis)]MBT3055678.1 tol-pal system protein YbgF [Candidatus Thiodiazotropha sp. (ex Codakia orbicularis)]